MVKNQSRSELQRIHFSFTHVGLGFSLPIERLPMIIENADRPERYPQETPATMATFERAFAGRRHAKSEQAYACRLLQPRFWPFV